MISDEEFSGLMRCCGATEAELETLEEQVREHLAPTIPLLDHIKNVEYLMAEGDALRSRLRRAEREVASTAAVCLVIGVGIGLAIAAVIAW